MEVYEFDKCLLDRLEESMNVLSWKDQVIPASQIRSEWAYYIELQIEPAGWLALWKIPRVICEELHVRYPTIVFGYVEQVHFKTLKAIFIIQAVQDDVHLPERHEVLLEDLWPTKQQENLELNIERTADCVDSLRFFYKHVWMAWDNDIDDDMNWVEKHLESRIKFCYDLRKRSMKTSLAGHIRKLLAESKYLQQRREYLELGLTEDEDDGELDKTIEKTEVTDLMRLHLRLAIIRNEMELLENPEMRRIYEEIKFPEKYFGNIENTDIINKKKPVFFVMTPNTLDHQIDLLQKAKKNVDENSLVQNVPLLQEVLATCSNYDCIYLSPGRHTVKFLENMYDGGKIFGLVVGEREFKKFDLSSNEYVIICSSDDESILFVFDGSFSLQNLTLDCRNVRTGVLVKFGTLHLRNCLLIGNGKTSTQQGILCGTGASVVLEDCTIQNFAIGITVMDDAMVQLNNSKVVDCNIGIDLSIRAKIQLSQSKIINSKTYGFHVATKFRDKNNEIRHTVLRTINEWKDHFDTILPFIGEFELKGCGVNIFVLNTDCELVSRNTSNILNDVSSIIESPI